MTTVHRRNRGRAGDFETPHALRSVTQPNGGLAQARNRGLRESRRRFVVFLDADDRLAPAARTWARRPWTTPSAFVFGRCTMMDRDGTPAHDSPLPEDPARSLRELLRRNYIWTPAVAMFRREAVERAGGFNPKVNAAADYELYLHIARHHPAYDHGAIVAHDRRHDENMSGNAGRMLRETLEVLWSQRAFLEADAASLTAYCEGLRLWRDFYATQLADEIRTDVRRHEWLSALAKATVLAEYHPRGLWHHFTRKHAHDAPHRARSPPPPTPPPSLQ